MTILVEVELSAKHLSNKFSAIRKHFKPASKPQSKPKSPSKPVTAPTDSKSNDSTRNKWKIGSKVEIYSEGQSKWQDGKIIDIFTDKEGEWLQVKYNGFRTKEIQRFSDHIRPKPKPKSTEGTNKKTPPVSTEEIRSKILHLIQTHEPNANIDINNLMKKWKNKEHELLYSLCIKYRQKYTKILPKTLKNTYQIGPKIGSGGFAVVRKCKRKSNGMLFAMKIIQKSKYENETHLLLLENEINTMRKLSHPNIVKLHDIFENDDKICLILDLCEGKGIFDAIIENDNKGFSELDAKFIFYYLCLALEYIHNKYIVHRDLKIEDLLFRKKNIKTPSSITLIDFGLCGCCANGMLNDPVGTPNYVSPEVLCGFRYNTQSDMWSIGVILYILLSGYQPFYINDQDDDIHKLYHLIKLAKYEPMTSVGWYRISNVAKDLVSKLLQIDPEKRLSATHALSHPWLLYISVISGYIRKESGNNYLVSFATEIISRYYEN